MNVFDAEIDKQIRRLEDEILQLEQQRLDNAKKIEGIQEFDAIITRLCEEKSLTENELYVSRSEQIEEWITGMAKQTHPSSIYLNLTKHFARRGPRATKPKKESSLPKPRLAVGTYEHPYTKERIEKVKRNPRLLDEWINEHGLAIVRTWKVG